MNDERKNLIAGYWLLVWSGFLWVETTVEIRVLKDEPDNRILECAASGKADIIVTGDKEMLRLIMHGSTKIISLNTYLRERS